MSAKLRLENFDQRKVVYTVCERQMATYPEAYPAGTCIYRRKVNAKMVEYNMILEDGRLLSGNIPLSKIRRGHTVEDRLRMIYELGGIA